MILLRKILFPFAILYGLITQFRNFLFDVGILKSSSFEIPVIAVGNLSVGGTGKTPQIEYLIRLLSPKYNVATLSRGYKRKSEGFILADETSTANTLGDEPFQFHRKFPNVLVAVDADRRNGIKQLLKQRKPDIILLDDAFQHRKVKAGFYILLTAYGDLYCDDFMLPTGNLRESRNGEKRADVVIVTKCPTDISASQQSEISNKLRLKENQHLYFATIDYDDSIYSETETLKLNETTNTSKLLIAGIAKPKSFFAYLRQPDDVIMEFPDHHQFSENDISSIKEKAGNRIIITTEKDYVRLKDSVESKLYYLPIKTSVISKSESFDNTILNYVETVLFQIGDFNEIRDS